MTSRIRDWTALAALSGLVLIVPGFGLPVTGAFPAQAPAAPASASAQEASTRKDEVERTRYAVGMNLGTAIRGQSADLDVGLILRGFRDAYTLSETPLTQAEMRLLLRPLQAEAKRVGRPRTGASGGGDHR